MEPDNIGRLYVKEDAMYSRRIGDGQLGYTVIYLIAALLMVSMGFAGNQDPRSPQIPATNPPVEQNADGENTYIPPHAPDQIVVKFTNLDYGVISDFNTEYATVVQHYLPRLGVYLLGITNGTEPIRLTEEMQDDPRVFAAHPNFLIDPMQSVQGSFPLPDLYNSGSYDNQPATDLLMTDQAHTISTGAGIRVGVVDGGINYNHPALEGRVVSAYDYIDNDNDAYDEPGGENSGHGTFVAGVIHLIAPEAEIYAYRVCDPSGEGDGYVVAEAIMRAVDDGCVIINLSLVTESDHDAIATAIDYARTRNVLIITAAGNGPSDELLYPASDPYVIAVGAIDNDAQVADFSNNGYYVDVYAPGVDIYCPYVGDGYAWWSGTSFAAPFVSGQAALIMGKGAILSERYSREWVIEIIKATTGGFSYEDDDAAVPTEGAGGGGVIDIMASLSAPVPDFAVLLDPHFYSDIMVARYGSSNQYTVSYILGTTDGGFHNYTIEYVDNREFLASWVGDPHTPAFISFSFDVSGLPLGIYQDTIRIQVEGVYGEPITKIFTLQVTDGPSPIEGYGIFNYTMHLVEGDTKSYDYTFKVLARRWDYDMNQYMKVEMPYEVTMEDSPEFLTGIRLNESTIYEDHKNGLTTDYWLYTVNAQSLAPGFYYDTVYIYVDSAINNPFVYAIELEVRKPEYIQFEVIPPVPDNMIDDGYNTCLRRYEVTFNDIDVVSTRVDTFYASLAVDGDPRNFLIQQTRNSVYYGFIDVDPMSGVTNDTIRFIMDWSLHNLDPADVDTALGYFWRSYKLRVDNVADISYYLQIKIYLSEGQASSVAGNGPLDAVTNYPNPFNPDTDIRFSLTRDSEVNLSVFNILGQKVKTLVQGSLTAGLHSVKWDGTDESGRQVASGIYLYKIVTGDVVESRKMILMK